MLILQCDVSQDNAGTHIQTCNYLPSYSGDAFQDEGKGPWTQSSTFTDESTFAAAMLSGGSPDTVHTTIPTRILPELHRSDLRTNRLVQQPIRFTPDDISIGDHAAATWRTASSHRAVTVRLKQNSQKRKTEMWMQDKRKRRWGQIRNTCEDRSKPEVELTHVQLQL